MKNNQHGFGLTETLVSMAVISVITYGVMNQAELIGKVKGKAEFSEQAAAISGSIKVALGDTQTCTNFMSNVTIGGFADQAIPSPTTMYGPGSGEAHGGEIQGRNLSSPFNFIPNPDYPISGGGGSQNMIHAPILKWDTATSRYKKINGIDIKKVQLVSDGYRLILRITFEKSSVLSLLNIGGSVVTKDIIIRGNKSPDLTSLIDCESDFKVSIKEFCLNSNGTTWDNQTQGKCIFPAILKKSPPVATTKPVYLIGGKLISQVLVMSSTASCSCPSSNCLCTCSPVCPAGKVAETPPRFVVNGNRLLFPIIQINGPQRCGFEQFCYTRQSIPAGLLPVGKLIQ